MRGLYKYPQTAYPYGRLVEENGRRGRRDPELELLQTGAFDESRYWDVAVEYAKADTDDILIRITASNRGPEPAPLHLLPTLWFRNTWSWKDGAGRPRLSRGAGSPVPAILAEHHEIDGVHRLHCEGRPEPVLHRERVERAPALGRRQCLPLREGRHSRARRRRPSRGGEPGGRGDEGGGALSPDGGGRRERGPPAAPGEGAGRGRRGPGRLRGLRARPGRSTTSIASSRRGGGRPTSSTPTSSRHASPRTASA